MSVRALAVAAAFVSLTAAAADDGVHEIALTGHRALQVRLPSDWQEQRATGSMPSTAWFASADRRIKFFVTPVWSPTHDARFNAPEHLRPILNHGKHTLLAITQRSAVVGYAFVDELPDAQGRRFVTQGLIAVDELAVAYSVVHTDRASPAVKVAIASIVNATRASR